MKKFTKEPLNYLKKLLALKRAGIGVSPENVEISDLEPLNERIRKILGIQKEPLKSSDMFYFIMYDIEDNKVRTQISKYLIKKGCIRIQKSIFIAKTERVKFSEIHHALKSVNDLYENADSIILVPISTDIVSSMKLIGQNVDIDIITQSYNTLFI